MRRPTLSRSLEGGKGELKDEITVNSWPFLALKILGVDILLELKGRRGPSTLC